MSITIQYERNGAGPAGIDLQCTKTINGCFSTAQKKYNSLSYDSDN